MKMTLSAKLMLGLAMTSAIMSVQAQAQDDLLFETGQVLESEQIDIDGNYNRPSAADRMAKMRQQLEKQNENMMRKKIEDIRVQQEQEMTSKLRKAFEGGLAAIDDNAPKADTVAVAQAAPQRVEAVVEAPKSDLKSNKVTPFFGVANYSGDNVDFETNLNLGLSLESEVSKHFSFGINFTYSTMDITDTSNTYINNSGYYYNGYYSYPAYNNGYYNTFGQGREMNFKRMMLEVNSKFFITADTKIRPFIGLGVGYNRASLKYNDDGGNYSYNNVNFGDEEYSSSFISGTATLGAEINFSETVGAVIDARYTKGLGSGFNSESTQSYQNPDQVRLENVGQSIEEAHLMSLNAGLIIRF